MDHHYLHWLYRVPSSALAVGVCFGSAALVVSLLAACCSLTLRAPPPSVSIFGSPNLGRVSSSGAYRTDHFLRYLHRNLSTVKYHRKRDHHLIFGGLRIRVEDSACFFDFHKCRQAHHNPQGMIVVIQVALHGVSAPSEVDGFFKPKAY